MKALVTGGAGFIGSHLSEALADRGYEVVILDNLSTGKIDNIEQLLKDGRAEFIGGSVTDLSLVTRLVSEADYVFHLAAIVSIPRSIEDPLASFEVSVRGTVNILSALRESNVKKLVFSSSCAVYGSSPSSPMNEDLMPCPESPYAADKLAAENYCRVFRSTWGVPVVCLRYFNVFGPRQNPSVRYGAVVPNFIRRSLDGEPLVIYGDGSQARDFLSVHDVVRANVLGAEAAEPGVYNIGSGEAVTVNRLAGIITRLADSTAEPVHEPARPGDPRESLADITRAAAFGYRPEHTLEESLAETVDWMREPRD